MASRTGCLALLVLQLFASVEAFHVRSAMLARPLPASRHAMLKKSLPRCVGPSPVSLKMGETQVKEEMIVLPGDVKVSRLGVGAWAWGDRVFWGYDDSQEQEAQKGFDKAVACGVNLFDTAEVYGIGTGWGHSETLCGKFARECADKTDMELVVATKFAPLPNRFLDGRKAVARALRASLERLGTDQCDLYQLHWPGFFADRQFWDGLADAYDAGLVKSVGVSNYSAKRLRAVHKLLKERDIPLATNQIQYSLLHRTPEMNGVKEACDELGVKILAYSPLAQGCLTGRYSSTNLPSGPRGRIFEQRMDKIDPLLSALKRIGEKQGKTCSQVALNWLICKDVIPIPGARNEKQAEENCGALGWRLSAEEVQELDEVSKSFVDSSVEFPGMPLAQM